jgi:hypothetical protein
VLAECVAYFDHHRPTAHCIKQRRSNRFHLPRRRPTVICDVATDSAG